MMERQIGHMVRLIDDLLDISRITSGKIRLQRQSSELAALVDSAVEANRAAIASGGIHLSVDLPNTPIWLDVDPARFVQIVSNVLHNAVKFTDRDGSVALSARVEDDALVLTVADTGVGMSSDVLPRVFDLFMQDEGDGAQGTGWARHRAGARPPPRRDARRSDRRHEPGRGPRQARSPCGFPSTPLKARARSGSPSSRR
jgi:signal transduction histidine kinase